MVNALWGIASCGRLKGLPRRRALMYELKFDSAGFGGTI